MAAPEHKVWRVGRPSTYSDCGSSGSVPVRRRTRRRTRRRKRRRGVDWALRTLDQAIPQENVVLIIRDWRSQQGPGGLDRGLVFSAAINLPNRNRFEDFSSGKARQCPDRVIGPPYLLPTVALCLGAQQAGDWLLYA
ncbi:hypothetical protein SKAU_G00242640 [Synaphobranchus kaupii]|uniref:Uncharacterized protein n=1 Tax=Synaphobranchus kaupii TaxID=118154 RepID=A0A9Q1F801_SYNKA|nr:hypothetical protein SKAU_G00242640 [Synaphobranchus kaupii]